MAAGRASALSRNCMPNMRKLQKCHLPIIHEAKRKWRGVKIKLVDSQQENTASAQVHICSTTGRPWRMPFMLSMGAIGLACSQGKLRTGRVKVGVGKRRLDTLVKDPLEGRRVCDVDGTSLAGTAGNDPNDTSLAVSDDSTGITWRGEGAVLMTVRVDGQLHGSRANAFFVVFPDERLDAGSATDGHAGAVAVLDNYETDFAVRVEHCRMAQLGFLDDVQKVKEATTRVFEGGAVRGVRVHLQHKVVG